MSRHSLDRLRANALVLVGAAVATAAAFAQPPTARDDGKATGAWTAPRTRDGHPDIEGVWNFATLTPLERPPRFAELAFITLDEAVAWERQILEAVDLDRRRPGETLERDRHYNEFWMERGRLARIDGRVPTSLIVDPPDGRLPPRVRERPTRQTRTFNELSDFTVSERCLRSAAGPPFIPGTPDGNLIRITQTRDHIAITQEKFHEVRVVSLDGRPHLGPEIRSWLGDSIGRWDGDTLIVDSTNFTNALSSSANFDGNLHLVERFTRVSPDTLLYEFTVNDPTTFAKPWTVRLPMTMTREQMYENACHEGNYAIRNILNAARLQATDHP
jgi:hypothetical protein